MSSGAGVLDLRAVEGRLPAIVWKWGAVQHKAGQESVRHSGYEERAQELLQEARLELDEVLDEYGALLSYCRALRGALADECREHGQWLEPQCADCYRVWNQRTAVLGAAQDGEREP